MVDFRSQLANLRVLRRHGQVLLLEKRFDFLQVALDRLRSDGWSGWEVKGCGGSRGCGRLAERLGLRIVSDG